MALNKAEKVKINWLNWVLDFCNADLGTMIHEWEKHYLVYTLDKAFYPRGDPEVIRSRLFGEGFGPSPYGFPEITDEIWERVLSVQAKLKNFIATLITTREKEIEERNYRSLTWGISAKRAEFVPILSSFIDGSCQSGYIPFIPAFLGKHHVLRSMLSHFSGKDDQSGPAISGIEEPDLTMTADDFSFEVLDGENSSELPYYYLGWLFGLLDGTRIQWIQKCKGCNRFFLNPTERTKMFCNSSCTSRSIMRMKREELRKHPKKYNAFLKKQREYMRKQYERMMKAQYGPNVKVGRKPRKRVI